MQGGGTSGEKTAQARISCWERGAEKPTTPAEKFAVAVGARIEIKVIPGTS